MTPESISYPKSRAISISIFLSLALHSLLFYVQVKLMQQAALPPMSVSHEKLIKPMMLLAPPAQLPPKRAIAAPAARQVLPVSHAQISPQPPIQQTSVPQIQPVGRHRYRVGTGFDAPDTDYALALGEKTPDGRGGTKSVEGQRVEQRPDVNERAESLPMPASMPAEHAHAQQAITDLHSDDAPLMAGRAPVRVAGETAQLVQAPVQQQPTPLAGTPSALRTPTALRTPSVLSFLSQQRFTDMMRQNILANQDDAPAGGIGMPGHSGGMAQQRGDPKYLHYNSKVYTAIQQSMDVTVAQLSRGQHAALLDGVKHPARVRFALDSDGKPHDIRISVASGNERYDALVLSIIAQASFPSIPRSFDMRVTYHNYGIILYADGTPREHIGVAPYIEGE